MATPVRVPFSTDTVNGASGAISPLPKGGSTLTTAAGAAGPVGPGASVDVVAVVDVDDADDVEDVAGVEALTSACRVLQPVAASIVRTASPIVKTRARRIRGVGCVINWLAFAVCLTTASTFCGRPGEGRKFFADDALPSAEKKSPAWGILDSAVSTFRPSLRQLRVKCGKDDPWHSSESRWPK
jgi:hypothetical protein